MQGAVHPDCSDYTTTVPLFSSGAEAAENGMRDVKAPGEGARDTIKKLIKLRNLGG